MSTLRRCIGGFALGFLLAITVSAQTETGQITGTVLDPTGAAIPNATVTAKDLSTNAVRTVNSPDGNFVFPNLLAGRYEVSATAQGFQTVQQTVTLAVGAKLGTDLHLPMGTQTTVVSVSEAAAVINTETQTIGQNVSTSEILNLPTVTRNPYDLVKTVGNTTDADPAGADRGVGVSVNGLRSSDVGILLDGVPNVNNFDTTVAIRTPLDSVGEITVLTSNFTAEYGRAVAGVINVDTMRGSNAYHGTVYEFNRVSGLASNSFDNNANGISQPVFTRNQFGFSAGGAIVKDKLFVFGNPEWIRVRSTLIQTATIVTPQLIAASDAATQNFFSTFGHLKSNIIPLQTFSRGDVCNTGACLAIPASTPIYQKVAYPVPADSGGGSPQNTSLFAGRVDYNLSNNTQLYFRYARYDSTFFPGTVSASPYQGYDTAEDDLKTSYVLSGTHVFSPSLVSQTKVSFNRIGILQPLGTGPIGPTLYTTLNATNSLGNAQIVYPGYSSSTPGGALPFGGPQNYVQVNEDVTKTFGKHNFRFGGLYTYLQDNRAFGAYEEAVAALGTNVASSVSGLVSGTLHDFQAAIYPQGKYPCINGVQTSDCTLTLPVGAPDFTRSNRYHEAALYAQDGWKVTPRLTINLGLRWEYFGPQRNGNPAKDSNFFFGPGANIELASGTGQVLLSTDPKNPYGGLWHKIWTNFEPRVGVAYDLFGDGKTSLRGGYGIGFEPNFGNVTFNVIQNPPNYAVIALTANTGGIGAIPITTANLGPLAGSSGTAPFPAATLRAVDPNIQNAYAHLWSGAVEHQFTPELIGAVEYTGSKGVNLYTINRLNIPGSDLVYAGQGTATQRINPQYSYINFRTNGGYSNYDALNLRLEMRNFAHKGLTLRANYTWSHALDNISNTFSETTSGAGNLGLLDPLNPGLDYGSADFDIRHRIILAAIWEIPYKGNKLFEKEVLSGWSIVPNFTARTGAPFSLWDCTNAGFAVCPRAMYDTPFHAQYTDTPTGNPNQFNYFSVGNPDTTYTNPLAGVSDFGPYPGTMTGRNVFVAPGNWNLDFAVHKEFPITERFKLQFRAEAFNIFNHSNLYVVYSNTDLSATSFVTAARGVRDDNNLASYLPENRNLQLALKLIF